MTEHLYIIPILLFSIIIHEVAHGYAALKLGDPTAQMLGRLTLNPVPHIDLIGSIFIPLFSLLTAGSVFIAWAKPVPVNRANFARPRRDDMLVSIAGPASNLVMALGCSVAVIILMHARAPSGPDPAAPAIGAVDFLLKMFYGGIYLNIVLALFNLIPVPPLDGSHVLAAFLPPRLARAYQTVGFAGLLAVIFLMRVPWVNREFFAIIESTVSPFRMLIHMFT